MAMLSVQVQPIIGHVMITPTKPIPEGNVLRKLTIMQNIQIVLHLNRKATDTTPPTAPASDLTGKATTTDPVEVTDPNTKVELLDKDGLSVQVQPIIRACHDYTDKTYS